MYSLRHANGAEMAASAEFSREEFTRAFAHNSRYADDSYSYASKHDELQATAPYTEAIHNALTQSAADSSVVQPISPMRLTRMQSDPQTRLIGTTAVCQEKNCSSQFEYCISCESFKPNSQYVTEAKRCCELLQKRIECCRAAGDDDTLQLNERLLVAYKKFIQRATSQ